MMDEAQLTAALQRIHELTQQNSPESAGVAWFSLLETVIDCARVYSASSTIENITRALRINDIPVQELLNATQD